MVINHDNNCYNINKQLIVAYCPYNGGGGVEGHKSHNNLPFAIEITWKCSYVVRRPRTLA